MEYTAIYEERWMSGSHWHCLTKMKRMTLFEHETVLEMLKREEIEDSTVFLFVGHPKLQGE